MKASEKDIGKLCKFFNGISTLFDICVLKEIIYDYTDCEIIGYEADTTRIYNNCIPLSAEETQQFMELVK